MSEDDASKARNSSSVGRTGTRPPGAGYTPAVSLFKAASTVSLLTLASRVTGMVRDLLMASVFGASAMTDAFNVAFRLPNMFRRLFGEGAFSQAFVPVLGASKVQHGDAATHLLINHVATVLTWVLVVTTRPIPPLSAAPLPPDAFGSAEPLKPRHLKGSSGRPRQIRPPWRLRLVRHAVQSDVDLARATPLGDVGNVETDRPKVVTGRPSGQPLRPSPDSRRRARLV